MKFKCNQYLRLRNFFMLLSAVVLMTSCDNPIFDYEGDCSVVYKIRFRYDKNLKWADAFANEVKSINLCAFDENGILRWQGFENGETLAREGYTMTLDLEPGKYHLIAWCGLVNDGSRDESFTVPDLEIGKSTQEEVIASMNHSLGEDGSRVSNSHLWSLFHGVADVEIEDPMTAEPGERVTTMPLTKDTNHVRVILQHLSSSDINVDDFEFKIEADNGQLDYHNNTLPDSKILYQTLNKSSGGA